MKVKKRIITTRVVQLLSLQFFFLPLLGRAVKPPDIYKVKEVINTKIRHPSFPYITGDTFRSIARFKIDEFRSSFNTDAIKNGDIIFLRNYWVDYFFARVHPHIKKKYILITHNSVWPSPGKYAKLLNDNKIIAWFAQNADLKIDHPKFFPIPVGIANAQWPHGNVNILNSLIPILKSIQKNNLVYVNFSTSTNKEARAKADDYFSHQSFCQKAMNKPWSEYLLDLARSKFVISPPGNGLDCHRTWEALLMGSIPIVKTSTLDKLYEDLPVIIVREWEEVTEEFLNLHWEKMKGMTFNTQKIYAHWWIKLIKKHQYDFLSSPV